MVHLKALGQGAGPCLRQRWRRGLHQRNGGFQPAYKERSATPGGRKSCGLPRRTPHRTRGLQ